MAQNMLPPGLGAKLKDLVSILEQREMVERPASGSFELKVNHDEALWYVAYSTVAEAVAVDPSRNK
jgi:hypothetical protein